MKRLLTKFIPLKDASTITGISIETLMQMLREKRLTPIIQVRNKNCLVVSEAGSQSIWKRVAFKDNKGRVGFECKTDDFVLRSVGEETFGPESRSSVANGNFVLMGEPYNGYFYCHPYGYEQIECQFSLFTGWEDNLFLLAEEIEEYQEDEDPENILGRLNQQDINRLGCLFMAVMDNSGANQTNAISELSERYGGTYRGMSERTLKGFIPKLLARMKTK